MTERMEFPRGGRVVAIVQARLGSVRFPRKVLQQIGGTPALELMMTRLQRSETINTIVLAIPDTPENNPLEHFAIDRGIAVHRGSESDVLDRYYNAAVAHSADIILRLTGDCPLIDWTIVDQCVRPVLDGDTDHSSTSENFPDGLDVEVLRMELLERAAAQATEPFDREHVTPFIRRLRHGHTRFIFPPYPLEDVRVTLDEQDDLAVIAAILQEFGDDWFLASDIDKLARTKPEIFYPNRHLNRDEGARMSSGQKMWKRAQAVIAGGTMLLSKRPDMHSQTEWPAYFSRAKGCRVWDLDERELIDVGFMGIGTNILGYGNDAVDDAVKKIIDKGNLSTLNAPEEVLLAEKLCEIHPWADMARFTRSGGEAGAVAVRIARAATGKETVAFCGYHGWHDWYLAANLAENDALDGHLLPGLQSSGVPRGLKGTAVPFTYNDLESLRQAVAGGNIAAIYMEVERNIPPSPGFLEGVREVANAIGAVLVFDECTSGFRRNFGGLHMHYGVNPDLLVLGKTLGNGYAINAVLGIRDVMRAAWETFISSTFWTERIGPAAALATLKEMERSNAPGRIHEIGMRVQNIWQDIAHDLNLPLSIAGLPSLTVFGIEGVGSADLKTILTELFLERNFLGGTAFYASLPHEEVVETIYFDALSEVLGVFAENYHAGTIDFLLPNGTASSGFVRMT